MKIYMPKNFDIRFRDYIKNPEVELHPEIEVSWKLFGSEKNGWGIFIFEPKDKKVRGFWRDAYGEEYFSDERLNLAANYNFGKGALTKYYGAYSISIKEDPNGELLVRNPRIIYIEWNKSIADNKVKEADKNLLASLLMYKV